MAMSQNEKSRDFPAWLGPIVVAVGIALLYLPFQGVWHAQYPPWSRLDIATVRVPLVLAAAGACFVPLFLPLSVLGAYSVAAGIAIWLLAHVFYASVGYAMFIYPMLLLLGVPLSRWTRVGSSVRVGVWVFAWVSAVLLLGLIAEYVGERQPFKLFWIVHPAFAFIAGLRLLIFEDEDERWQLPPASMLPGVANFIFPLPLAIEARFPKDRMELRRTWWLGAKGIIASQILFLVLLHLVSWQHRTGAPPEWLMPVWLYIPFFIFVVASMTLVTGIQRVYGTVTRPAIGEVWKAVDPSEIWARSSPHVVEFILQRIYVPVVLRFRSQALGLLAALCFVAFHATLFQSVFLRPLVSLVFPAAKQSEDLVLLVAATCVWVVFNWFVLALTHRYWRPWIKSKTSPLVLFFSAIAAHFVIAMSFWIPVRILGPIIARWIGVG